MPVRTLAFMPRKSIYSGILFYAMKLCTLPKTGCYRAADQLLPCVGSCPHEAWILLSCGGLIAGLLCNVLFYRNCITMTNINAATAIPITVLANILIVSFNPLSITNLIIPSAKGINMNGQKGCNSSSILLPSPLL